MVKDRSLSPAIFLTSQDLPSATGASSPSETNPSLIEAATVIRGVSGSGLPGEGSGSRPPQPGDRSPAAVAKVLVGHRLNHFYLEEMIGGGGMGAVFRAKDEQLDRTVAVKVVPFADSDTELQRRFRNEAQSAAKLDHPHIAQVFDVGADATWHYIVFEYIRGINLRDLVNREGILPISDAVLYTMQLADALQHASDRGITHRDVKPSNVLLTSGRIKLVDMGLARSEKYDLSADMTASGVTLGTFDYISPEQARDPRLADIRSDLYSLGCTLFFMLTGRPPYAGGTMLQKLLAHGNEPPPDIQTLRNGVSDELSSVLQCLLAKDPADRFQTPEELIDALQNVASRSSLLRLRRDTTVVSRPAWQQWVLSPSGQTTLPWIFGLTIVVAIAIVLQFQSMMRREEWVVPQGLMPPVQASGSEDVPEETIDSEWLDTAPNQRSLADLDRVTPQGTATESDGPLMFAEDSSPDGAGPRGAAAEKSSSNRGGISNPRLVPKSVSGAEAAAGFTESGSVASTLEADGSDGTSLGTPVASNPRIANRSPRSTPRSDSRPLSGVFESTSNVVRVVETPGYDPLKTKSLAEAIAIANAQQISMIELEVEQLVSQPIRIDDGNLTIRSVVGGTTILFDETQSLPAAESLDRQSLSRSRGNALSAGSASNAVIESNAEFIELQDIHLHWIARDHTSLFQFQGTELVNLTDCVITVDGSAFDSTLDASRRRTNDRQLSQLDSSRDDLLIGPGGFTSDTETGTTGVEGLETRSLDGPGLSVIEIVDDDSIRQGTALTFLDLNNVLVRGEATLVVVSGESQLDFAWDNGLLAISGAMIRVGGSAAPSSGQQRIELTLDQLVVDAEMGLVQMVMDSDQPYPVEVVRNSRKSVFVVRGAKPHVVISGAGETSQFASFLQLSGTRNAFDSDPTLTDPLVRLVTADGVTQTVPMSDMLSTTDSLNDNGTWLREKEPRMSVRWASGDRPQGAWHDRQASQYTIADAATRGFDAQWLPPATLYNRPGQVRE